MSAGMMPALDSPGVMMPGQLGPMMRVLWPLAPAWAQKAAVSCTGMPSVMTTAKPIPASTASMTALLVNFGGTKITVTSAPVSFMPSATEPKTGTPVPSKSTLWPALRGFTPPTMFVPEASMRRVCLVPSEPVMPWTSTLLSLFRKIAMVFRPLLRRELGGLSGSAVHRVDLPHGRVGALGQDLAPQLGVVAVQTHHQRLADVVPAPLEHLQCLDDAVGDRVARGDTAEDVDEDALDLGVAQDDLQAVGHDLGGGTATDVQEVGGRDPAVLLTGVGDHVQRGHDQARAVADDADLALELDVVQALGGSTQLQCVEVGLIGEGHTFEVAKERVVVQDDLAVERDDPAVLGQDERVDLHQGGVLIHGHVPEPGDRPGHTFTGAVGDLGLAADLQGRTLVHPFRDGCSDHGLRSVPGHFLDLHAALG